MDEVDMGGTISLCIVVVSLERLFYPFTLQVLWYSELHENNPFYILRI